MARSLGDYVPPVLVKEVRQALRGRLFSIAFVTALGLAALLCIVAATSMEDSGSAGEIVGPILSVLLGVLLVYVPFHAQQSMRQEESEGARDLLALSPLGPWSIVIGKLFGALVVAGLILAAFLPFLVTIAQLPGVDTVAVLVGIAHVCGVSVLITAVGVSTGVGGDSRVGRGAGFVLLALVSLVAFAIESRMTVAAQNHGTGAIAADLIAIGWLACAALGVLALGLAASRLARDDRDDSRGQRLAWLGFTLATVALVAGVFPSTGTDFSVSVGYAVVVLLLGTVVAAVLVTEDDRLHLESAQRIAGARTAPSRWFAALLVPGGGRGVALMLATGSLVISSALVNGVRVAAPPGQLVLAAVILLSALGTSLAYAMLPGAIILDARSQPAARRFVRTLTAVSLVVMSLGLPLVLIIATQGGFDAEDAVFSPLLSLMWAASSLDRTHRVLDGLILWAIVGGFALLMSLPKAWRGVRAALRGAAPRPPAEL
ncbi:MAG: hypothetical protein R3F49_08750 [Planctomycetota bacterium]